MKNMVLMEVLRQIAREELSPVKKDLSRLQDGQKAIVKRLVKIEAIMMCALK